MSPGTALAETRHVAGGPFVVDADVLTAALRSVIARYHRLAVRFSALADRCRDLHDVSQARSAQLTAELRVARAAAASARECVVCMQPAERWVLLRPCGHVCACAACALVLARCPVCRGAIAGRLAAFL